MQIETPLYMLDKHRVFQQGVYLIKYQGSLKINVATEASAIYLLLTFSFIILRC